MSKPFTIYGHRGARAHAPENTLLGLETGIRLGADWLEIDVQHHAGELWLMHDLTLERTTNGRGYLNQHSAAELRALDAGQGQRIPTLAEAMTLIEQRAGLNIELKSWDGCAEAVADHLRTAIAQGWPLQQLRVSSFHLPELWAFKQALPEVSIGVLSCGVPLDWAAVATEMGADSLHISDEFVDQKLIDDAHARGLKVLVYTVNDPAQMRALMAQGIDGIFTDAPGIARAALEAARAQ